ncbi:MAG: ATP-binding protein [Bacilli bacterium]|nr:ATP-binding protein [Bacilli bacterium]
MDLDFTQPSVTVVEKSLKGKSLFIYGDNGTGKTANAVKASRPFAIPFENGLNAIAGLPFFKPEKWADTKKIVKQFRRPEVKALYDTILIDTADKLGDMLEKYICSTFGISELADADGGAAYLAVTKYVNEFIDGLVNEGYTVLIIGHDTEKQMKSSSGEKYMRHIPRGNKRVIAAIADAVDIVGYCESNGFDEETGDEILSTIYLKDGKYFKARSRWIHIQNSVTPFTIKGVEEALIEAIKKGEKEDGSEYYVDKKTPPPPTITMTFEEVCDQLKEIAKEVKEKTGEYNIYTKAVEGKLGEGMKVSDCTPKHQEVLEELLDELKEIIAVI